MLLDPLSFSPFRKISFIKAHTGCGSNRTLRALLFEKQHRVVVVVE